MIELILSTLADFGLIQEDYKHKRRIGKKEELDGTKRPMQKVFLQPSVLLLITVLVTGSISALLFFGYQRNTLYLKKTKKELATMIERMEHWKEKFGQYPTDLNELIGNSPIRQGWLTDSWNRPYQYEINEKENVFEIRSAGADGKFKTEDDIISK